ncbi:hypothetical protein [Deinococcus humi]|uniref:Uncharacterized protein n=1 Tax=Deinococcus humi TaxID=662880 RepID=A0A7W8K1Q5_9DEIO|nr:hypothetical protein [Deinococcus humi]MBB5365664.1 hypothetical protein [Deinococcus humi]GGO36990.1 hypothetical protein GCM10008949_41700 [Deinococcus humi]
MSAVSELWPVNLPRLGTDPVGKFVGLSELSQRIYLTALREVAGGEGGELGELLHQLRTDRRSRHLVARLERS